MKSIIIIEEESKTEIVKKQLLLELGPKIIALRFGSSKPKSFDKIYSTYS